MREIIDIFDGEYGFLSNFYQNKYIISIEKIYQSEKATCNDERFRILMSQTSGQAKRAGSKVETMRKDWKDVNLNLMKLLLDIKFDDPILKQRLLDTGGAELIEGNLWHDNFWGNCKCNKCENIEGKNILGKMLMDLRTEIRGI